jgi:hypothetical protein
LSDPAQVTPFLRFFFKALGANRPASVLRLGRQARAAVDDPIDRLLDLTFHSRHDSAVALGLLGTGREAEHSICACVICG